ncbi:MAG: hypothetical protein M3Q80_00055 [bacterium]|nr:hypothetical protein [bacterium]
MEHIKIFQQQNVGNEEVTKVEWSYTRWMAEQRGKIEVIERQVSFTIAPPIPGLEGISGGAYTQITVFYKTKN